MASKLVLSLALCGAMLLPCHYSVAQLGDPAPDFTVTDTHGEEHHLYEYLEDGKLVVLDFFFTTCGPCIYYAPQANLAFETYGCNAKDVVFIAIDFDDTNDEVVQYDEDHDILYPSVSGLDGGGNDVVNDYNVVSFPRFYFIDSTKTIIDQVDPPTLIVFKDRLSNHGISETVCDTTSGANTIAKITTDGGLSIAPNPVNEFVSISVTEVDLYPMSIEIRDVRGALMAEHREVISDFQLNTTTLPNGLYLIKVRANDQVYSSKIIVSH